MPYGEVLLDNTFDIYPAYSPDDPNLITGAAVLDDDRAELIERAMLAVVKQRGGDPLAANEGIQWAEYALEEAPLPAILLQVSEAVQAEGPGVKVTTETLNGYTSFVVSLTNST
jgi:hypothetical protein